MCCKCMSAHNVTVAAGTQHEGNANPSLQPRLVSMEPDITAAVLAAVSGTRAQEDQPYSRTSYPGAASSALPARPINWSSFRPTSSQPDAPPLRALQPSASGAAVLPELGSAPPVPALSSDNQRERTAFRRGRASRQARSPAVPAQAPHSNAPSGQSMPMLRRYEPRPIIWSPWTVSAEQQQGKVADDTHVCGLCTFRLCTSHRHGAANIVTVLCCLHFLC